MVRRARCIGVISTSRCLMSAPAQKQRPVPWMMPTQASSSRSNSNSALWMSSSKLVVDGVERLGTIEHNVANLAPALVNHGFRIQSYSATPG